MKKQWFVMICVVLCLAVLSGCGQASGVTITPKPAPTLSPYDGVCVTGTVELKLDNNMYVVTCSSDLPSGALVSIYLLDDNGNEINKSLNVLQNNGVCSASFSATEAKSKAQTNAAEAVVARVEFFPGASGQPQDVAVLFGDKGSELAGDNVITEDETGQTGVRIESGALKF